MLSTEAHLRGRGSIPISDADIQTVGSMQRVICLQWSPALRREVVLGFVELEVAVPA